MFCLLYSCATCTSSWNMFSLLCLLLHVQVAGTCSGICSSYFYM
jgi:hypothetical protein